MKTHDTINILCATDNRYAPYCGIMLTSLLENNKHNAIDIYIFGGQDIRSDNIKKFKNLEQLYNCHVNVIAIDDNLLSSCPVNHDTNITLATYYRLLAPQILPISVHKLIYLDCDMIISDDIKPIWDTPLENKAIAGVIDCEAYNESIYHRLGDYTQKRDYYNAGMTVYNMDFWRKNDVAGQAFKYIEQNSSNLYWMDQDVLNVILADIKVLLPIQYNFQTLFYLPRNWKAYSTEYQEQILEAGLSPVVIHYNGPGKPWVFRYYGAPYYQAWTKYQRISQWTDATIRKPIVKYFKYLVKRYLVPRFYKKQIANSWHIDSKNKHFFWV